MRVAKTHLAFVSFAVLTGLTAAQQADVPVRIAAPVSEASRVVLRGNTHPLARTESGRGPAPSNLPLNRMLLVLRRSPEQDAILKTLLDQQQNKSSPSYHVWLNPEQFGRQFGPSDQDVKAITSWLVSHGLQVNRVAKGRVTIEFSGTAGQVKEAFHTEIHKYELNGKEHWANSTDPEIPSALSPVVAGIATLHNFPRKPQYHVLGVFSRSRDAGSYQMVRPLSDNSLFTGGGGCGLAGGFCYGVAPYDFATIYNVLPLWNATSPIDGTGQEIAIVGQSDISPQDFDNFRADLGLPPATLNIIQNGPDPGALATEGDELESDLDVQWSGSVAKGATIDFVTSASTNSSAGVDLSAEYIVDNNIAPVMSESYGACELEMGTAGNLFYNQLWQQAAAEGITVFVSTGDSGSAGCDQGSGLATNGLAVNGIASTPYNIAVGGTDFDDLQNQTAYWNSTDDPITQASAKSYIPEMAWNDSCTNSEFFQLTGETNTESDCNDSGSDLWPYFLAPVAGSGGASSCTSSSNQSLANCSGGYPKPSWQVGIGVPTDGVRDVPDVSLFAGDGLNSSFYVVCESDIYGGCDGTLFNIVAVGGTSAAAPSFAGIMAMVNQKTQSRQGNANYVLYPLAAKPGANCDSTRSLGPSCIFYDVTTGTIAMPCATGSPNCVTNVSGDQNGVLSGYGATAGYDPATGLGSVNAANLVNNWDSVSFQPTASTLTLNPTTQLAHGSPVSVNIVVSSSSGTGTPTGQVSLLTSAGQDAGTFTLTNGSVTATTQLLRGGNYTVHAHYAGDGTYAASDSSPGIPVMVDAEPSVTTIQAFTLDQKGNVTPFTSGLYGGSVVYLRTSAAGQSGQGAPTGTVNITQTFDGATATFPGDPFALNNEGYTMTPVPVAEYPFFDAGIYSMAAAYSGDASFNPSASSAVGFTITQAPTTLTTVNTDCPASGQCILNPQFLQGTFFASVISTTSLFSSQPTGTMTFYVNGIPLESPVAIDTGVIPPFASFSTSQLPLGQDNITAQYNGDTNYTGSTSAVSSVNVGGTFSMTANPTTINIASPGQSGSTIITFTAQNGLTGSAPLSPSACSTLPPQSTCSFNATTITFTSSTTSVPVALTISTTAPNSNVSSIASLASGHWQGSCGITLLYGAGMCFVIAVMRKQTLRHVILRLAVLLLIAVAVSCGGSGTGVSGGTGGTGGTGGGGGSSGNGGTPVGNYSVAVTVTLDGISQTVSNLSANVQ